MTDSGDANSDNESLRTLILASTNTTARVVDKLDDLIGTLATGLANFTAALGTLTATVTPVAAVATQLTDLNTNCAQFGQALTSTAGDIKLIAASLDASASASKKMSPATNPYDRPLNLGNNTGVKGWEAGVELPPHISFKITVAPENKSQIRGLVEYANINGFGLLFNVPTAGSGIAGNAPITHAGGPDTADHQLRDFFNICTHYVKQSRKHVLNWAGYIHGDIDDGLSVPDPLEQKRLDFESTAKNGNAKLVAANKHQLRIKADQLMHILRQHIDHTSLEGFLALKEIYAWTRENGSTFFCGLTILWLILESVEPQTVVDAREHETLIETLSLINDCDGNIRTYLSKLKHARNELTVRHGKDYMKLNKFLEHLFNGLAVVKQESFFRLVETHNAAFMLGKLDEAATEQFLKDMDDMFIALQTSGKWTIEAPPDPKVMALTTENKKLSKKLNAIEKQQASQSSGTSGGNGDRNKEHKNEFGILVAGPKGTRDFKIELWRTVKKGSPITRRIKDKDVKFFWCQDHRDGKGLYMRQNADDPPRHDHDLWRKDLSSNKKRRNQRKRQGGGGDDSSVNSSASEQPQLVVKKKQKRVNTLVTQYNMSHENAVALVNDERFHGGNDSDVSGN